jgi:hypothetical protein
MRINPVNRWFRPKTFGIGWSPASPEGWAVTLGLVVLIILAARSF